MLQAVCRLRTGDRKTKIVLSLILLFVCWLLLHVFTIGWETPHTVSPEVDGIPPVPGFTAKEMMAYETFKYPPLQYLIVSAAAPRGVSKGSDARGMLELSTARIIRFRYVCAVMEFLTAAAVFLMAYCGLHLASLASFTAAFLFLTAPVSAFYSQTTNMDIPAAFWFTLAVCSAFSAEKHFTGKTGKYMGMSLLTGILIGCTFCTKDQTYALMILPAFALFVLKWKKEGVWRAVFPFILWGAGFLLAVGIIYLAVGGREVFLAHFRWITGEGSASYAQVSKSMEGYLILAGKQMYCLLLAVDLGQLLLTVFVSVMFFLQKRKDHKDCRPVVLFLVFLFGAFISHYFFFSIPVRYVLPRYFIELLPFTGIFTAYLLERIDWKGRMVKILLTFILVFVAGEAFQTAFYLMRTPRGQLRQDLQQDFSSGLFSGFYTAESDLSPMYLQRGSEQIPLITVRTWAKPMGADLMGIPDLLPEDLPVFLKMPKVILTERESVKNKLQENGFVLNGVYGQPERIFPQLFAVESPCIYLLKAENIRRDLDNFSRRSLEEQMLLLQSSASAIPQTPKYKLLYVAKKLRPFSRPDMDKYLITEPLCRLTEEMYRIAGREKDRELMRSFIGETFPYAAGKIAQ